MEKQIISSAGLQEIFISYNKKDNKTTALLKYKVNKKLHEDVEININALRDSHLKKYGDASDENNLISLYHPIDTIIKAIEIVKDVDQKYKLKDDILNLDFIISNKSKVYVHTNYIDEKSKTLGKNCDIHLNMNELHMKGEWEFAVYHELGHIMQDSLELKKIYKQVDIDLFNENYQALHMIAYLLIPSFLILDLFMALLINNGEWVSFTPTWKIISSVFIGMQSVIIPLYLIFSLKHKENFGLFNQLWNYTSEYLADKFAYEYMNKELLKETFLYKDKKYFLNGKSYTHPSYQERAKFLETGVATMPMNTLLFHEIYYSLRDICYEIKVILYKIKEKNVNVNLLD